MLPGKIANNMIIDDIKIIVKAGNGGDGLATFSKTK
jgi:GTPase involved in cell partitioning and DNA repair